MSKSIKELEQILYRLDGKSYPAYKDIRGSYEVGYFSLHIDHVQGDPFAAPSRLRVRVPMTTANFPPETYNNRSRLIALRDYLTRQFAQACRQQSDMGRGSGKSGLLGMDMPKQEILERSAIIVTSSYVEARFVAGLPAQGRRIRGRQAAIMLCQNVPKLIDSALLYQNLTQKKLVAHLIASEQADFLREILPSKGLVAFVADGSILPRRSGVDDRPLQGERVVPFKCPENLRVTLKLPYADEITGLGIPHGITLIVGGGYHGKSTLLSAIERGVYNHIPGDGRELVVTNPTAVKIRSEDGRRIEGVNISPFINNLPYQTDSQTFRTDNASGSTSQAANIIEALEVGTQLLLLDEDTCATNLMIRDARMQALVEKQGEPITPFIDRVRQLAKSQADGGLAVSTILVLGGSGDYFDVADIVIRMNHYQPLNVTKEAKEIARKYHTGRQIESMQDWPHIGNCRIPIAESLNPRRGKREVSIKTRALRSVSFGTEEIEVDNVAQLIDEGQLRAIGQALNLARQTFMQSNRTMAEVVEAVIEVIDEQGLDVLDPRLTGDYVAFRPYEFVAALNRLRTLRVRCQ